MIAHTYGPSTWGQVMEDFWGSVAAKPNLFVEFQVSERIFLKGV